MTNARTHGLALFLVLASLILPGCTYRLVESQPMLETTETPGADRGGLVYSLPMTIISVTGTIDAGGKISYAITPTLVPDTRARYRLKYHASGATDDVVGFTVDKNGLLTTGKGDATDRTGDIVVAVAKTIAAVQASPSARTPTPADETPPSEPYPFSVILTIDDLMNRRAIELPDGAVLTVDDKWIPRAEMTANPKCTYSVCFRTVFPLKATITEGQGSSRIHEFAFVAVNPYHVEGIDLRSAALVARTNSVTFETGLITGVTINQPSTTLAIVSLPLTVLKAILAVPAELLTLKIKNVESEASLAKAQADVLAQMKAVLDAQQALQKAKDAAAAAKPAPVAGAGSAP
jgi:hypothetical protein